MVPPLGGTPTVCARGFGDRPLKRVRGKKQKPWFLGPNAQPSMTPWTRVCFLLKINSFFEALSKKVTVCDGHLKYEFAEKTRTARKNKSKKAKFSNLGVIGVNFDIYGSEGR